MEKPQSHKGTEPEKLFAKEMFSNPLWFCVSVVKKTKALNRDIGRVRANFKQPGIVLLVMALVICLSPVTFAQSKGAKRKAPAKTAPKANPQFEQFSRQADAARQEGRLEDAIVLYNQALRASSNWVEGWWYLGSIFYTLDRYGEGRDAFRNLLVLQKTNGPGWAMIGLCEFKLKNYDEALADIQYARQLGLGQNKELTNVVRFHAALLLTRAEQFELAYEALRDFAREGNESMSVIEAMGINLLRMPFLPAEAPADKREIILLAGRAAFFMAARRVGEAQGAFQELLARYPDAPNVHYAYGAHLLIESPDQALEEFKRELKISPAHIPALLQIAFEYLKRNDAEAAKPYAEQSVKIAPNLFATRNALGRVLTDLGQIDEAIKELESGVKLAPESPEMRFALARAYARAGRKDDAARERAMFVKLDKEKRTRREGAQAVGGISADSEKKPKEKPKP
ncbi:MAG: tetratricopeptide repeat protein [Acidobacteriota bacterium]